MKTEINPLLIEKLESKEIAIVATTSEELLALEHFNITRFRRRRTAKFLRNVPYGLKNTCLYPDWGIRGRNRISIADIYVVPQTSTSTVNPSSDGIIEDYIRLINGENTEIVVEGVFYRALKNVAGIKKDQVISTIDRTTPFPVLDEILYNTEFFIPVERPTLPSIDNMPGVETKDSIVYNGISIPKKEILKLNPETSNASFHFNTKTVTLSNDDIQGLQAFLKSFLFK